MNRENVFRNREPPQLCWAMSQCLFQRKDMSYWDNSHKNVTNLFLGRGGCLVYRDLIA